MDAADAAWRASLAGVAIADIVTAVEGDRGSEALPGVGAWLTARV